MATIKKNILETPAEPTDEATPAKKTPKEIKPPKEKLDPNELVLCQGTFTKVQRKDMSKRFGGNYSKQYIKNKGL